MSEMTPADVMAMSGNCSGFGTEGLWLFAILALLGFGNGGLYGNNRDGYLANVATSADIQRSTEFAALERQNNEGVAATRQAAYDVMGAVKDSGYNSLSEIRSLETAVENGFANQATCCCELGSKIDATKYETAAQIAEVRYDMANMFANANANTTEQVQKVLDVIAQDKIAALQAQVNQLTMTNAINNATCGVVKYPTASTYYAGTNPFCANTCGCGNGF